MWLGNLLPEIKFKLHYIVVMYKVASNKVPALNLGQFHLNLCCQQLEIERPKSICG